MLRHAAEDRIDWLGPVGEIRVATDTPSKPTCGVDPNTGAVACGQAYVLIAGSGIVVASGSISMTPAASTSRAGGDHTVKANVTSGGNPLPGQVVDFSVTGQNAGATGTCVPVGCVADSSGDVSFTYHGANGAGDDTIKGSFTDARGSLQAATVQKRWTVNAAPVLNATSSALAYTEGDAATAVDSGLTASDADDANLDSAKARLSSGFESGDELLFSDQSGISGSFDGAAGVLTLTGSATVAEYQAALRSVGYRHTGDDPSGSKAVEFTANDGEADSNAPTRDITVAAVDDAPIAADDAQTVSEDASATTVDVLANDSDADDGAKHVASTTQPAHGTVTIAGGGTEVTYQPDADYCDAAPDTFTYELNGGSTATVSVTVDCVDDAPTAADDDKTVEQDSGATGTDVLANDTDGDGGANTVTSVTQPANGTAETTDGGKRVSYRPNTGYCNSRSGRPDTFTYKLNGGSEATVTVTVRCAARAPEGEPEPAVSVTIISHRDVITNKRGALVRLRCRGTTGARCAGNVQLRATRLPSRLQAARVRGNKSYFGFATGRDRGMRVAVPAASRKRLAAKGKAVARAIVRLDDGTVVTRLVTLYPRAARGR